jgi:hypothetical protein
MADYKLADMLGIAGATIGIIIAAGILLGMVNARYTVMFDRYRSLTGELRGHGNHDVRHNRLRRQIVTARRQLAYLSFGSMAIMVAVLTFLGTVAVASLAVIYPKEMVLRTAGTVALFTGLGLIGLGVLLLLLDTLAERPSITYEAGDLDELPSYAEARHE